jgi:two-component system KDP operon response regulator KdpE
MPGCADTCQRRWHDPQAHESHGRQQAEVGERLRQRGRSEVGPLVIDFGRHRVVVDGERVHVTPNEFLILARLMRSAGTLVTSAELLAAVWGRDYALHPSDASARFVAANGHLLRVNLSRIRTRLGSAGWLIQTIPSVGYVLTDEP